MRRREDYLLQPLRIATGLSYKGLSLDVSANGVSLSQTLSLPQVYGWTDGKPDAGYPHCGI